MRLTRTVTVDKPLHKVFTYLSDFTTTTEWDPGTVRTVRTAGNGSVGNAVPEHLEVRRPPHRAHLRRGRAGAELPDSPAG